MSSRCRVDALAVAGLAAACLALLAGGCERERREYRNAPEVREPAQPRMTDFQPGAPTRATVDPVGLHYENNAYHITQGGRLFRWFNCNGCHGAGGGGMGPALMDAQWRYGGRIDQIHASILEGRPNGMPAWHGKLTDMQAWQLAAYVRALSGNVRKDAAPSRRDAMAATPPPIQMPEQPPRDGDPSATSTPQP
jgi:cytochrome c oxidase cbb3-type subunit III